MNDTERLRAALETAQIHLAWLTLKKSRKDRQREAELTAQTHAIVTAALNPQPK